MLRHISSEFSSPVQHICRGRHTSGRGSAGTVAKMIRSSEREIGRCSNVLFLLARLGAECLFSQTVAPSAFCRRTCDSNASTSAASPPSLTMIHSLPSGAAAFTLSAARRRNRSRLRVRVTTLSLMVPCRCLAASHSADNYRQAGLIVHAGETTSSSKESCAYARDGWWLTETLAGRAG